jgi:drug/metabolite transporter (DMT)-like permease
LRAGLGWGALTGVLIAGYTVNDGHAVRGLGAEPLLFYALSDACRAVLLTPAAARRARAVRETLRRDLRAVLGVALLSPLAYVLVLEAMTRAPISHVAPAREVSMLFAAFLGARLLAEGEWLRRVCGAALIAAGVACLALAG